MFCELRLYIKGLLMLLFFVLGLSEGVNIRKHAEKYFEGEPSLYGVESREVLVAALYYPWYSKDFRGGKYIRGFLDPPQNPALGEYNDKDSRVIRHHIAWSIHANIKVWFTSWFGPESRTDSTIQSSILASTTDFNEMGMKMAIFYETGSRLGTNMDNFSNVRSDIKYMAEHFFGHPSYLKIDGRPVFMVYLTRVLNQKRKLNDFLLIMKRTAKHAGYEDLFIIGDQAFGQIPNSLNEEEFLFEMRRLDAITGTDVYGSLAAKNSHATKENFFQ